MQYTKEELQEVLATKDCIYFTKEIEGGLRMFFEEQGTLKEIELKDFKGFKVSFDWYEIVKGGYWTKINKIVKRLGRWLFKNEKKFKAILLN